MKQSEFNFGQMDINEQIGHIVSNWVLYGLKFGIA